MAMRTDGPLDELSTGYPADAFGDDPTAIPVWSAKRPPPLNCRRASTPSCLSPRPDGHCRSRLPRWRESRHRDADRDDRRLRHRPLPAPA
ncbi:hypothetical protein [Streptomyces sp. NPDC058964]|uniref:hypothetical protein n=1 Tax=Streptomyces sp. NPDC058964 TaxID=3346681 RepID=UPI00368865EF